MLKHATAVLQVLGFMGKAVPGAGVSQQRGEGVGELLRTCCGLSFFLSFFKDLWVRHKAYAWQCLQVASAKAYLYELNVSIKCLL